MSKNAVKALAEIAQFSRGTVEIFHLATVDCGGEIDDVWIPKQASEGGLLITTDRGKKKSRGGKLPVICQRHGLRHVMMSAAVHKLNQFDKLRALFSVWPKLIEASAAAPGAGFVLKKHSVGFDLVPALPMKQRGARIQQSILPASFPTPDNERQQDDAVQRPEDLDTDNT
ncbi:MAG TPA: hypothetical protein VFI31_05070 [Pirellulales bacterium]|nr:hypothetical protein [Pirellulales bacterium]